MKIIGYSKTVIGSREKNEDSFLACDDKKLYAVADGVGGGVNGDVASKTAIEGIRNIEANVLLKDKFLEIQNRIFNESVASFGDAIMGTTLTCLRFLNSEVELCHVGDSRCYLFSENELKLLTIDHEIFDELYGGMVLSSYLGLDPKIARLTIQEKKFPILDSIGFLLCTDGLYKQVPYEKIKALIRQYYSLPHSLLDILCEEATKDSLSDNVTIIYVEVEKR